MTTPTPPPEWHDLDTDAREPFRERARHALYDLHACGREWSAWSVGTMTEEDFTNAADTEWHVNHVACEMYDIARDTAARLAAAEAEIARLRADLADAEERAAGPFFAECRGFACYGRRLEPVIDDVLRALGEHLEEQHEPEEWAAMVARWAIEVEHGVHLSPCLDDDGGAAVRVGSRQGVWWYDLRLTVTPDGCPVLSAERRVGGAR